MKWNNEPMTVDEAKAQGEGIFMGMGMARYLSMPWSSKSWLINAVKYNSAQVAEDKRSEGVCHTEAMAIGNVFEDRVQFSEMMPEWYFTVPGVYKVTTAAEREIVIAAVYNFMAETGREWPQVLMGADKEPIYRSGEDFKPRTGKGADVYDSVSRFVVGCTGRALAVEGWTRQVDAMIQCAREMPVKEFLFNPRFEKQVSMVARLGKFSCFRGRIDALGTVGDLTENIRSRCKDSSGVHLFDYDNIRVIVDIKTTFDCSPKKFGYQAEDNGYQEQCHAYGMMLNRCREVAGLDPYEFVYVLAVVQRPKDEKSLLANGAKSCDSAFYVTTQYQVDQIGRELEAGINAHDAFFEHGIDTLYKPITLKRRNK